MARRVGDDELAPGRGEIAVGHVNRDALLAFGAQAVGEQRQIDAPAGAARGGLRHAGQLVFVNAFGIVEQTPDQRALAVVHAAGREEPQQVFLLVPAK